jgi:hypothetical protein
MNNALSETLAIVGKIDPASLSAGAVNTTVIDMKYIRRLMFIVAVGALGTSGTVDFLLKGDTSAGGSFATTITGKSITQLTKAGSDDNKQVIVEVSAEEVMQQGFRYVRGVLTVGTAASQACVIALGGDLRYTAAADYDLASVDEIVN